VHEPLDCGAARRSVLNRFHHPPVLEQPRYRGPLTPCCIQPIIGALFEKKLTMFVFAIDPKFEIQINIQIKLVLQMKMELRDKSEMQFTLQMKMVFVLHFLHGCSNPQFP